MRRLCIAQGTWQLVTLAAALREADAEQAGRNARNDLVMYEPDGVQSLREWMRVLAPRLGSWSSVRWDDGVAVLRPKLGEWPPPVGTWLRATRALCDGEGPDEIWIPHLDNFFHRLLMEAFPKAGIVLYEDGYLSALPERHSTLYEVAREVRRWPGLAARGRWSEYRAATRLVDPQFAPRYARRVQRMYLMLSPPLPIPAPYDTRPARRMRPETLRGVLADVLAIGEVRSAMPSLGDVAGRSVLFMAHSYHRNGLLAQVDEAGIYARAVRRILDAGYTVYWKDHPRATDSFLPGLQSEFGVDRLRLLEMPAALPVQLIAECDRFAACVSVTSASLFYLRQLYGMKVYTLADAYTPFIGLGGDYHGFPVALANLPTLEQLSPSPLAA